jgi:hypothetical protein
MIQASSCADMGSLLSRRRIVRDAGCPRPGQSLLVGGNPPKVLRPEGPLQSLSRGRPHLGDLGGRGWSRPRDTSPIPRDSPTMRHDPETVSRRLPVHVQRADRVPVREELQAQHTPPVDAWTLLSSYGRASPWATQSLVAADAASMVEHALATVPWCCDPLRWRQARSYGRVEVMV